MRQVVAYKRFYGKYLKALRKQCSRSLTCVCLCLFMRGFIYGALTGNFCGLLWEVVAYKRYFLKQPKFTSVNCCYVTMNYAFLYG